MKQIFDWLREQLNRSIYSISLHNNHGVYFKAIDIVDVGNLIDEAEAKWEADCCEWKGKKNDLFGEYTSTCGHKAIVNPFWTHCPYCGKPIKILEVE